MSELIDLSTLPPEMAAAVRMLAASVGAGPHEETLLTVGQYIGQELPGLHQRQEGTAGTYNAGLLLLADGDHSICACQCPACSGPRGCPCACGCQVGEGGHHVGRPERIAGNAVHARECAGGPSACSARCTGVGGKPLREVSVRDIEDAVYWAGKRAGKKQMQRVLRRADTDRRPVYDGRGAQENMVAAARWLLDRAIADGLLERNVAKSVKKPPRIAQDPRALDQQRTIDVFETAVTTGQDPVGDGLCVQTVFQSGARLSGVIALTVARLDVERAVLRLKERKNHGAEHNVAITPALAQALHDHVLERGHRVAAPPHASEEQRRQGIPAPRLTDPLLYRRPVDEFDEHGYFVRRQIKPVTYKAMESLRDRIRRHLDWAAAMGFAWHDLRRTIGTMLERIAGHAVANYHLGHRTPADTTDIYVRATLPEDAAAMAALFGCEHPLAPSPAQPSVDHGYGPRLTVVRDALA